MRRVILALALLLAFPSLAKGQTTTVVTATVKDLSGNVVPTGQITFTLQPPAAPAVSGIGTFSGQTVTCTINQDQNGGPGDITSLARASNVVTATFSAQTPFVVGDVLSLGGWSDATFDGTSAFTVTSVSATSPWTVTWNQTAANSSATGGFISALRATPGPGSCTVTQNTALTPAGTYYKVTLWPTFGATATFNFYALSSSVDLSSVVPTPGTVPAYSFVDLFSNQSISGNKTFTGNVTFSGSILGNVLGSFNFTAPSEFAVSGSPCATSGCTVALSKASISPNLVAAGPSSGSSAPWNFRSLVPADIVSNPGSCSATTFFRGDQTCNKPASQFVLFVPTPSAGAYNFDASQGNTFQVTLGANSSANTLTNAAAGQLLTFVICQPSVGGPFTFAWPSNVLGGQTIGTTAGKCNTQTFVFGNDSNAHATSSGSANDTNSPSILGFFKTTLSADISPAVSTPTTVLTQAVTMPTSGCPCRALVSYGVYATSNNQTWNTWVSDATNVMASAQVTGAGTNNIGLNAQQPSPVTYANGAAVTFRLTVEMSGAGGTVKAAPFQGSGGNSWMTVAIVASN